MNVIILILMVVAVVIFIILLLHVAGKKIKEKDEIIKSLNAQCRSKDVTINNLMKEFEFEKDYNERLVKKLTEISNMSISDVLSQLQNNAG